MTTIEPADGLHGAGPSIENPNAQRNRGCGQSFSEHPTRKTLR